MQFKIFFCLYTIRIQYTYYNGPSITHTERHLRTLLCDSLNQWDIKSNWIRSLSMYIEWYGSPISLHTDPIIIVSFNEKPIFVISTLSTNNAHSPPFPLWIIQFLGWIKTQGKMLYKIKVIKILRHIKYWLWHLIQRKLIEKGISNAMISFS